MNQTVHINFGSYSVTIIVKCFREEAGSLYEVTETTRWFSPTSCA